MPVTWPSKNLATSRSILLPQACAPSMPGIAVNMVWIPAAGTYSNNSIGRESTTTMGHEARRRAEESCMSPSPYLPDVGILTLVPCEWESPWLSRHQILTRLAKYFHVVWCEPAPWWREAWRRRERHSGEGADGAVASGLTIYRPEKWLPQVGRPHFLACWTAQQRLRRA